MAERGADVPQRPRPDLAVAMDAARQICRVMKIPVDTAQTMGLGGGIGDRIPIGDTGRVGSRRDHIRDRDGKVIGKTFANGTGVQRASIAGDL